MKTSQKTILQQIIEGKRVTPEFALQLWNESSLSELGIVADKIKHARHGYNVFFVQNFHIEPTNVCVYNCHFCSYSVSDPSKGWSKTKEEILHEVLSLNDEVKELHIVGGSNPVYDLTFYSDLLKTISKHKPHLHIKAFTASEIAYFSKLAGIQPIETLTILKKSGLQSIPGGGAEIFADEVRNTICPDKISGKRWIEIHRDAHSIGLRSNATMLTGHIETIEHRIDHMLKIRELQDETKGFQAFIPLKFKNQNNSLFNVKETSIIEDLKLFALARIFMDNIDHLKVYWPAYGKKFAQLALQFGVDDLDGTIQSSTQIYTLAGSEETNPNMGVEEARAFIEGSGNIACERDALYQIVPASSDKT